MINAKYVDGLELRIRELNKKLSNEADEALHLIAENNSLKAERDALAAHVEALRREIQSAADWFSAYWPELNKAQCDRIRQMDSVAKATTQHHLAEIREQAGRDGFVAGYEFCLSTLPSPYCNLIAVNYKGMAERYADQIRQEGK